MMNNCYQVTLPRDPEELKKFVHACDQRFEAEMDDVAESLAATPELRLLGLTGPTCSGKTTAAKKMVESLEEHGHRVHVISIDDFYYDSEYLRNRPDVDPDFEIDYDSEETIDVDLLCEKTRQLLAGKTTTMPRFNFKTGHRETGVTITPAPSDIFLFEGIQVPYPKVNAILSGDSYRSIYISPAKSIELDGKLFEPNTIRLMRRLVRDSRHRNSTASFTLYLWESVRKNEEKNIFPNVGVCHYRINSTMPYELGMLKPYLDELLPTVPRDHEDWAIADELSRKLCGIEPVPADYMTENSLYKEFI